MTQKVNRPIGVTIIAILAIISGIILLIGGIGLIGAGALFSIASTNVSNNSNVSQSLGPFVGIAFLVLGAVLLIIGIGYLIMSYGLLKGKGWAWTITIILTIISIAIQIISGFTNSIVMASITNHENSILSGVVGQIIGIAINIIILYYLYRPHVKAFFGKSPGPIAIITIPTIFLYFIKNKKANNSISYLIKKIYVKILAKVRF